VREKATWGNREKKKEEGRKKKVKNFKSKTGVSGRDQSDRRKGYLKNGGESLPKGQVCSKKGKEGGVPQVVIEKSQPEMKGGKGP